MFSKLFLLVLFLFCCWEKQGIVVVLLMRSSMSSFLLLVRFHLFPNCSWHVKILAASDWLPRWLCVVQVTIVTFDIPGCQQAGHQEGVVIHVVQLLRFPSCYKLFLLRSVSLAASKLAARKQLFK